VRLRNDLTVYDGVERWWTRVPPWLRILRGLVPARLAHLDRAGVDWRGKTVVDVGCGGGYLAEALAGRGARVIGVDPSPGAIAAARAQAARSGSGADYRLGPGGALPVADAVADGAACVDVLEHVEDVDAVLAEIARVLRPGARLLFDTINRTWLADLVLVRLAEDVLRLGPRGLHDPARFLRPEDLRSRLERAGFRDVSISGLGPVGVDREGIVRFGRWPVRWVQYVGLATRA
jgi:2-polyprenyl-6-hydroxyphenyl methylase/3-demethylubiquinone-9 3-methyltransferase